MAIPFLLVDGYSGSTAYHNLFLVVQASLKGVLSLDAWMDACMVLIKHPEHGYGNTASKEVYKATLSFCHLVWL
jgi:hypothetical protein